MPGLEMQGLNARIAPNCNTRSPCIPIESHIGIITAFIAGMLRRFNPRSLALALLIVGTGCNAPHAQSRPSNTSSTSLVEASAPTFPRIDELLIKEWSANHIVSAPPADDYQFLRRASLDILGTLPSPEALRAFAEDSRPNKHARLIDTLLADPHYPAYWSSYWEDILLKSDTKRNIVDRAAFKAWLTERFQSNTPWDQIVRDMITAEGVNSPGGAVRERVLAAEKKELDNNTKVNGAVNWLIQYGRAPQDIAGATSRVFLGVQIQCAQCHDHKSENWTMDQFQSFAAAFTRVRAEPTEEREKGMMRAVEISNVDRPRKLGKKVPEELRNIASREPKALDGTSLEGENPRKSLADWITSPKNPYFAKAIVNRIWSHFMGRGFFEPVDDQRPSNSITAPSILNELATDFAAHGYDLKYLIRAVTNSAAYRLKSSDSRELWSAFAVRPLHSDVLLNSIMDTTGLAPLVDNLAGDKASEIRFRLRRSFDFDVDEQNPATEYEGTIQEALLLQNGALSQVATTAFEKTPFAQLIQSSKSDEEKIELIYLRTLSRPPREAELARWKLFLNQPQAEGAENAEAPSSKPARNDPVARLRKRLGVVSHSPKERAFEDMVWAIFNSTEFVTNH